MTQVKRYACKCGKARLLVCITPESGMPGTDERYFIKIGAPVTIISVEQARKESMCFDCKYARSAKKELALKQQE